MSENYIYLDTLLFIAAGWYWAKTEWAWRIAEEKAKQKELALQIMLVDNSVSNAGSETYFKVVQQVEALISSESEEWICQQLSEDYKRQKVADWVDGF